MANRSARRMRATEPHRSVVWEVTLERPDAHTRIVTSRERDDSPALLTCCSFQLRTLLPSLGLAHERVKPRETQSFPNWIGATLGG